MPRLTQELALKQQLTPQQILQASIFQMNIMSLEQRVYTELEKNPALEILETENDQSSEEQVVETVNDNESDGPAELDNKQEETDFEWEELLGDPDEYEIRQPGRKEEDYFEAPIRATKSLTELLLEQFWDLNPTDDDVLIAEELIGNLNDDGYLTIDPILIADRMMLPESKVQSVLKKIQKLDPPGVGARNLQECLLIQVSGFKDHPLLIEILTNHFEEFANRRYDKIMQSTGCSREELLEVSDLVSTLNPKPGNSVDESGKDFIIPDLTVEETDTGWEIRVNDSLLPEFRISTNYKNMAVKYRKDPDVKKFVKQKIESAKWFIDAIKHRHATLMKVMSAIIRHQPIFFGKPHKNELVPMILKDIAEEVQMDISTISRVTNSKYVQLPFGVFELKSFFSEGIMTNDGAMVSNTVVKNRLRELVDAEDKHHPLSDEHLVELLTKEGYVIARRTVAKYRDLLKIPVARLRKEI
ncbi:MAG: RNA polymerase factor sigma-54 [Fidelibacterota bacterium]